MTVEGCTAIRGCS